MQHRPYGLESLKWLFCVLGGGEGSLSTSVLGPSILSGETVKETVSGFQEASGKGASSCLSHLPLEGKYSVHLDYITAQRRWGHCHQLSASGPRGVSLFLKKKKKKETYSVICKLQHYWIPFSPRSSMQEQLTHTTSKERPLCHQGLPPTSLLPHYLMEP